MKIEGEKNMRKKKKERNTTPEILIRFLKETKEGKYAPIDKQFIEIKRIQEEREIVEEVDYPRYINFA